MGSVQLRQYDVSIGQSQSNALSQNKMRKARSSRDLAENRAQFVKIHRFREIKIESSFFAALDIVTRAKARYRHRLHRSFSFGFHDDIVAIPVWQRDIT